MNYKMHYDKLIETRRNLDRQNIYTEKHHIIPICMGGNNSKENIINLTAREHFLAHWLLWRIHKNDKLANAFYAMTRKSENQKRLISYSSIGYAEAKEACAAATSRRFKGVPKSEEQRKKMSESAKGKLKSKDHRNNLSKALIGKKLSKERVEKMRINSKGGKNPRAKVVSVRNEELELIHTFQTITETSIYFGVSRKKIERTIKSNTKLKNLYFSHE